MSDFLIDLLKLSVPLGAAAIAWFANEARKRAWEEYARKEERYKDLVSALRGFYVSSADRELRGRFLEQLNLCWLYCPDHVIKRAYSFLGTVQTGATATDPQKEAALGELMLAIRRDLLSRRLVRSTRLEATDFRNLSAT